jgi:hypothetical protein
MQSINKRIPEIAVGCLMLLMVFSQLSYFWDRTVFGHDDLSQIETYYWNLESEGRWLIYLIFKSLRHFNTHVALIADFGFISIFGYVCARKWVSSSQSILIALLVMLTPSVVLFLDWPIIALPSMFLLAIAALVCKRMSLCPFFLIFGILFNATYSNVYFLLPLLFLSENYKTLLRVILCWLAGYVIGFAIAELITYIICGHFIELAEWRKPNYIRSWADIETNILTALGRASSHMRYMGKVCVLIGFLCIALFAWIYRNNKTQGILMVLIMGLVAMSCYAQSIPAGIGVSMRTAHCLYFSLILFVLVSCRNHRFLLLIMVLIWGGRCLYMNAQNLEWQNAIRSAFSEGIASLEISPVEVHGLVILANDNDVQEAVKAIEEATHTTSYHLKMNLDQWAAGPRAAGFKSLWYRQAANEKLKELAITANDLSFSTNGIYSFALCKEHLFVRINTTEQAGRSKPFLVKPDH